MEENVDINSYKQNLHEEIIIIETPTPIGVFVPQIKYKDLNEELFFQ